MALAGFPDLVISLDGADGNLDDISATVTTINGWTKEQILEEITAAGDADEVWATVGFNRAEPVVLTGPYQNADPSLWFQCEDDATWEVARTLRMLFLGGDTQNIETYIRTFSVNPARGTLHAVVVTLQPFGDVT